jgi:uncharacterized 2Fe-2S/4Fe-4S cluster protein (DUF4445 family)
MPKITFLPSGVTLDCTDGDTVFEIGWKNGIGIESACIGKASCGLCRVRIVEGEEFLPPYNEAEEKHLGNVYHLTKVRLSCQSVVSGGDVTVELAPKKKRRRGSADR